MTPPSSHRPLFCVVAIAAATAGVAAYLNIGRGTERIVHLEAESTSPVHVDSATHSAAAMDDSASMNGHEESPNPPMVRSVHTDDRRVAGNPIVAVLPPSMLASAQTISWDESTSKALELFMVAIFDADGDGMLDDVERIIAVRSLRDAVWPTTPNAVPENLPEASDEAQGLAATAKLDAQDRRLHHDVDEARRRDRQEGGDVGHIDGDLRAEIVRRFRTDDDGRLTVDEFARYMIHRNAGLAAADLNGDGQIDDADLRVFLDIASPID